jgi:Ribonuclease G/E
MTVIDVNTGKFPSSGGNLESTVTSNNLKRPRRSSGSYGSATSAASS